MQGIKKENINIAKISETKKKLRGTKISMDSQLSIVKLTNKNEQAVEYQQY